MREIFISLYPFYFWIVFLTFSQETHNISNLERKHKIIYITSYEINDIYISKEKCKGQFFRSIIDYNIYLSFPLFVHILHKNFRSYRRAIFSIEL